MLAQIDEKKKEKKIFEQKQAELKSKQKKILPKKQRK
jgi:hypothetical protein